MKLILIQQRFSFLERHVGKFFQQLLHEKRRLGLSRMLPGQDEDDWFAFLLRLGYILPFLLAFGNRLRTAIANALFLCLPDDEVGNLIIAESVSDCSLAPFKPISLPNLFKIPQLTDQPTIGVWRTGRYGEKIIIFIEP
jgi:hypothetical protein